MALLYSAVYSMFRVYFIKTRFLSQTLKFKNNQFRRFEAVAAEDTLAASNLVPAANLHVMTPGYIGFVTYLCNIQFSGVEKKWLAGFNSRIQMYWFNSRWCVYLTFTVRGLSTRSCYRISGFQLVQYFH